MKIKRDIYLNKLISKKHNGLIKVVTGIRRCGKSYLLFNLFKDHLLAEGTDEQHIIEIAFNSFENKRFRDPDAKCGRICDRKQCPSQFPSTGRNSYYVEGRSIFRKEISLF